MAKGYSEPRSSWGTASRGDLVERPTVRRTTLKAGKQPSRIRYHLDTAPGQERSRVAAIYLYPEDARDDFVYLSGGNKADAVMALFDECSTGDKALIIAKMQTKLIAELGEPE